jgi:SAM-dependent methyltransferase
MPDSTTSDIPRLRGPVPLSHLFLQRIVRPGDSAVDATCGNGGDTLLLALLTGPKGRVWAFDIQDTAIERTTQVLEDAGLLQRVTVLTSGHENLADHVAGPVAAVVFNLGYLPGGDRSVITRPGSTLAGLAQSTALLAPGGIVAITVYPGHEGGEQERAAVEEWAASLTPGELHVWRMGQLNAAPNAPYFIMIQRAA